MNWQVIQGDCLIELGKLPAESVHCCVTSPPYFGLRDYGTPGQLGLESTPDEYVAKLVAVFREVKRVLRDDGTLWLNLGDSYAGSCMTGGNDGINMSGGDSGFKMQRQFKRDNETPGLKPKDLVGIPWRVAFALQADGWWLRSDIIWHKPNPMPESVTDRPTKSHEYIFLLAKNQHYYYDAEAVKERVAPATVVRASATNNASTRKDGGAADDQGGLTPGQQDRYYSGITVDSSRNRRSVWTVTTQPFSGAHFAVFPPKLIEPCILAGTSAKGVCPKCGKGWERVTERTDQVDTSAKGSRFDAGKTGERDGGDRTQEGDRFTSRTTGWRPGCECDEPVRYTDGSYARETQTPMPTPATVLDPFGGSGTTAVVAAKHGRSSIIIDLSKEYCEMARKRIDAATRQQTLNLTSSSVEG